MSGFHFNLERVLHWRASQLLSEEARLRRLIEEESALKSTLDSIGNTISGMPVHIAALDEIRGSDLNRMAAYRLKLMNEREKVARLCREKKKSIAEQAEVHRTAKQRHRLLEELRSRRHQEWTTRMSRELDELAHDSYLARWKTL
jgi:hypothetical protein